MTSGPRCGHGAAARYDRWYDTRWGRYAFAIELAAVLDACGPLSGRSVVDAGCGTGRFTEILAECAGLVVGVDRDVAVLDVASRRLPGVPLVSAGIESLPFSDGGFDAAVAVCVLEFVADPEAAVADLARVVRPGGRIVIGALNTASPWGVTHRGRLRKAPWTDARFLTRRALRALAVPHGTACLRGFLYAPTHMPLATGAEALGRRFARQFGAFQVLSITKALTQHPSRVPPRCALVPETGTPRTMRPGVHPAPKETETPQA